MSKIFKFIRKILALLEIELKVISSSDFKLTGNKSEKLFNICNDLNAIEYHSAPAAKEYLNVDLFENKKLK